MELTETRPHLMQGICVPTVPTKLNPIKTDCIGVYYKVIGKILFESFSHGIKL